MIQPIDPDKQGRGVAILYRAEYHITSLENSQQYTILEVGVWVTTVRNKPIIILGFYHPPLGSSPGHTNANFIEDVNHLVHCLITNDNNLVILGDLNMDVQDLGKPKASIYNDTMKRLGLTQHVLEPTHKLGNTLDIIYTESLEINKVLYTFIGGYVSDHKIVGIEIKLRIQFPRNITTRKRDYKNFNLENFTQHFNNNGILGKTTLQQAVKEFKEEVNRTLDRIPLIIEKKCSTKQWRPWYNNQLLVQQKTVRTREKIYTEYREQHQWHAYIKEWNRYIRMLEFNKRNYITTEVTKATNNSRQLFKIIEGLLGTNEGNPIPQDAEDR